MPTGVPSPGLALNVVSPILAASLQRDFCRTESCGWGGGPPVHLSLWRKLGREERQAKQETILKSFLITLEGGE